MTHNEEIDLSEYIIKNYEQRPLLEKIAMTQFQVVK